jgi:DNA-binding response OmpR family regulator
MSIKLKGAKFMERKYKLLIVDDDKDILTEYGDYFRQQGFIVEVAHNGTEGLEKLRPGKDFDVALLDFNMPDMNGIELTRQAYQVVGADADIIIWSEPEEYDKYDAIEAIRLGVCDWFEKYCLDKPKFFERVKKVAQGVALDEMARIFSLLSKEDLKW